MNQNEIVGYIWGAAELLRGDYKQSKYGDIILPFTVLRRLDCVLNPTKDVVQQENEDLTAYGANDAIRDEALFAITGVKFYNTSSFTLERLRNEPNQIARNLQSYIDGFSKDVSDIFDKFKFAETIADLNDKGLLFQLVSLFAGLDLGPDAVDDLQMGTVYEELIRRFSEMSNETAGEHFSGSSLFSV